MAGITAAAPGCGSPANIAQAADALQTTLASMPGVSDAWVYHEESYAQGVAVNIAVDVSAATREQIADVADRIDATRFGLIANYAQNIQFWVTPDRAVTLERHSQLDATQIADDTERLRQIANGTDGRIDWFRSDDGTVNQLSFSHTEKPGAAILDAVRTAAGGTGLSISVSPVAASRQTPQMIVNFPLDAAEQKSVFEVVDSVPADVVGLRLDASGLQALEVVAHDPATAEQDLSKVITASDAVSARPLWLAWYLPTFAGGAPGYGGVVKVGDCSQVPVSAIQTVAARTDDGISTLQSRLQSKLDECGTPAPAPMPIQSQWTPAPSPAQVPPTTSVIDVVSPSPLRDAAERTGLPAPPAQSPCVAAPGGAGFTATRCATTTTVAASSGGGQPGPTRSNNTPLPRLVITPPTDLPVALPAAGGSGSSSGSGTGTGTATGSDAGTGTGTGSGSTAGSGSSTGSPGTSAGRRTRLSAQGTVRASRQ